MNYCPVFLVQSGQTDRRTESDAYEPTVQSAQVGSKINVFGHISAKTVRFSFCKKPLEAGHAIYQMIPLLPCPAHLLGNLR